MNSYQLNASTHGTVRENRAGASQQLGQFSLRNKNTVYRHPVCGPHRAGAGHQPAEVGLFRDILGGQFLQLQLPADHRSEEILIADLRGASSSPHVFANQRITRQVRERERDNVKKVDSSSSSWRKANHTFYILHYM